MSSDSIHLQLPEMDARERRVLERLGIAETLSHGNSSLMTKACRAALTLLRDLQMQGWEVELEANGVTVTPPAGDYDVVCEKRRVRLQEQLKRDEQLRVPSVRRFVDEMESPRERQGRFLSIFDLMRDGAELSESLNAAIAGSVPFESVVDPYVQVINGDERCEWTGLRLMDIWRYFRHTWSNQYVSTPGRSMTILVRDRATANHPVVGIASLGSSIVQLARRDSALGWNPPDVVTRMRLEPNDGDVEWMLERLASWRSELYTTDLAADGLWRDDWWEDPPAAGIDELVREAISRRQRHQRLGRKTDFGSAGSDSTDEVWLDRAQTDLFRSKRCQLAADMLRARAALSPCFDDPSGQGLAKVMSTATGRKSVGWIVRRTKAETVGTEIADITVCGAIAPYTHLLGGKLVASLLATPTIVRAYREKYGNQASEIASSMAGRRIVRPSNLVYLGTTSLYGAGSSQYNRIRVPAEILDSAADIRYQALGRSLSFGTSHLSQETVRALTDLAEQRQRGARVKSIFGEGASPKLRKVREGIDALGWPSEELLRHRRERIIYGVELAANPSDYLLRRRENPNFLFDPDLTDDVSRVADWWRHRWMVPRSRREEVLEAVARHTTQRPVVHGARVPLPSLEEQGPPLSGLESEEL